MSLKVEVCPFATYGRMIEIDVIEGHIDFML